eukprot:1706279-Amphidinium_carterae.1
MFVADMRGSIRIDEPLQMLALVVFSLHGVVLVLSLSTAHVQSITLLCLERVQPSLSTANCLHHEGWLLVLREGSVCVDTSLDHSQLSVRCAIVMECMARH